MVTYVIFLTLYVQFAPRSFHKNIIVLKEDRGDYLFKRLDNIKKYKNIDILFLGSSHALSGFDTRIFQSYGYYSFNLGSSLQTPAQSEMFLKKYVDSLRPKMIILETYPYLFQRDNIESEVNLIANGVDKIDFETVIRTSRQKNILVLNTFIYQVIKTAAQSTFHLKKKIPPPSVYQYIEGGYVEINRFFDTTLKPPYRNAKWMPNPDQKKALDNIVIFLRKKNIKLILVQSPIIKSAYNIFTNHEEIDAYFKSKSDYYNFNELLDLNDTSYFFDFHHLSRKGVNIFDSALIEICLKKKYPPAN
jgi:hypothetical protein